jgi:MFS family permease
MIDPAVNTGDVAHAIQLALAPAFLLTAIAGLLNVMTGRLARIIDRGRRLLEQPAANNAQQSEPIKVELGNLERRRYLASVAIAASSLAALFVCMVIASLFIEALLQFNLKWVIGIIFTGATFALITGLTYFLREVHLSTSTVLIHGTISGPQ